MTVEMNNIATLFTKKVKVSLAFLAAKYELGASDPTQIGKFRLSSSFTFQIQQI